jgi:hypothetical protein
VDRLKRDGYLLCHQPECVMPTRTILAGEVWHLGHDPSGLHYIGPTHPRCNLRDAAQPSNKVSPYDHTSGWFA